MNSPKRTITKPSVVTPERISTRIAEDYAEAQKSISKNPFGSPSKNQSTDEVKEVYHLIEKATGFIGGNAYQSAMYGELTRGSMQTVSTL